MRKSLRASNSVQESSGTWSKQKEPDGILDSEPNLGGNNSWKNPFPVADEVLVFCRHWWLDEGDNISSTLWVRKQASSRDSLQLVQGRACRMAQAPGTQAAFLSRWEAWMLLAPLPASLLSDNSESRDKKMKLTLYLEAAPYNMISFLLSLHYMSGEGDSQNSKYIPKITELPRGGHRIQRLTEPLHCPFLDATSRSPEVPSLLRNQVTASREGRTHRLWDPSLDWLYISTWGWAVCLGAQSCLTLFIPMDWSPPGSSIHGILQARTLEWVAMPASRGSSQPRDPTQVSRIADRVSTIWATREARTWGYQEAKTCFES